MSDNPYSIMFGKEPSQNIRRTKACDQILHEFTAEQPATQIYMISGVRGSGKTVFLADTIQQFRKRPEWITVPVSSSGNLLEKVVSALSVEQHLAQIFQTARINLSFFGLGFKVAGSPPITSYEIALRKMLESLKKHEKRVLIAIDEVIRSEDMIAFVSAFQLYLLEDLPIFLLMTGLFENIEELQNVKNLTFLYRAPKIYMEPFEIRQVLDHYRATFSDSPEMTLSMAKITRGYPYAFQLVGYYTWENDHQFTEDVRQKLWDDLCDYAYDIIWDKLSAKDREIAYGIASAKSSRIADIRSLLNLTTNEFNPYRRRLIRKGIIDGSDWGVVRFSLPLFERYVLSAYSGLSYD